jgi:hypothetical protein
MAVLVGTPIAMPPGVVDGWGVPIPNSTLAEQKVRRGVVLKEVKEGKELAEKCDVDRVANSSAEENPCRGLACLGCFAAGPPAPVGLCGGL